MTWPSAVATEAASYTQTFLPLARSSRSGKITDGSATFVLHSNVNSADLLADQPNTYVVHPDGSGTLRVFLATSIGLRCEVCHCHHSQPEGPYSKAVKIVHHDQYNFYNVATHTFFDQEGGRVIYLEGTYTDSFSGATEKTPRYNYNQVMYRVRLDDSRLRGAQE